MSRSHSRLSHPPVPASATDPGRRRLLLAVCLMASGQALADPLLTYRITVGGHALRVEVADTPEGRSTGLMHRRHLPEDGGMLFVFERAEPQAMWMKNTPLPLSVAFVGTDRRILNIEDMTPFTEDSHPSAGPALYAIETAQGWFARRGIRPGARVQGLELVLRRPR